MSVIIIVIFCCIGGVIMALINCPECGKEISDKVVCCSNCSYPLKKRKVTSQKPIFILLSIFAVLVVGIFLTMLLVNKKTVEERAVINSFKELDSILLAPDSVNVFECVSRDFTKEEDYNENSDVDENGEPRKDVMVYIHFSSSNKGGGITESEYLFACDEDGKVIEYMDLDDMEDMIAAGNMSDLLMNYDNYVFWASLHGWDEDYTVYTKDEIEKLVK